MTIIDLTKCSANREITVVGPKSLSRRVSTKGTKKENICVVDRQKSQFHKEMFLRTMCDIEQKLRKAVSFVTGII